MIFGKLERCVYQPSRRYGGYILFKDGKDVFKYAEVTLGDTDRGLLSDFNRYFKEEGEYEYRYDMIWYLFNNIPHEGALANAIIRVKDLDIIRSGDDKPIGVSSKITLEDLQKVLYIKVTDEDKENDAIREGFIEAYKFLEDLSNKIDSKISDVSEDTSIKDILFQNNNNPFQPQWYAPNFNPSMPSHYMDTNPSAPIKHINKLLSACVVYKDENKDKLSKFLSLGQQKNQTFLHALSNPGLNGMTGAEEVVDEILKWNDCFEPCARQYDIFVKPVFKVSVMKGEHQGLIKHYDLLKLGYDLNLYYDIKEGE